MKYENLKRMKFTNERIAKALGYKNAGSLRHSTAYGRIMEGVDSLVGETIKIVREGKL
jgi:hypothetical protein